MTGREEIDVQATVEEIVLRCLEAQVPPWRAVRELCQSRPELTHKVLGVLERLDRLGWLQDTERGTQADPEGP